MILKSLVLQNFRNYEKAQFNFDKDTIIIVGPNTSGKTNFAEAIYLLSTGKSFKAEKDKELIEFGEDSCAISGLIESQETDGKLEITLAKKDGGSDLGIAKKYRVNGVSKRIIDFAGNLTLVLFSPEDLDIIIGGPNLRRNLLDNLLEQVDRDYRNATIVYTKALRQRNALLDRVRESGERQEKLFEYWDNLLIDNGEVITKKREEFIQFINNSSKEIFDFVAFYDKSMISAARLLQYKDAEVGAGVTLVGPHRDDISFSMLSGNSLHDIKSFGSRGQQRLTILQLKLIELLFIEKIIGQKPILILDDIFSELDTEHIKLVFEMVGKQQTFITTTHKEFINQKILKNADVIELKGRS
ncbi:MAG: hypothetical protein A2958_01545 [Candidatus Levybacteria bacterium RIFCSPLOWO2_01_FULL_38_13]|nr:MAG: hypothetical protein A2629_01525 [Candidatus Levybacteria bacterium RIFCSPHIGHO2_01_FULL_41_15]OGH34633.1 MAG: hypothetical protein A2958_01545 [Candidatus Levybacteria bacterium RIFCSPLOWO2_01_FULL_38_13]